MSKRKKDKNHVELRGREKRLKLISASFERHPVFEISTKKFLVGKGYKMVV
jgi:hypothetical protein